MATSSDLSWEPPHATGVALKDKKKKKKKKKENWNQPKFLSTGEWINKMCIYKIMEYYSAMQNKFEIPFVA